MNTWSLLIASLFLLPLSTFAYSGTPVRDLSPLSYQVTQNGGTEKPYENPYWNTHAAGIYVDIITGAPLFSSRDKYDSGTGWPTFARPINKYVLHYKADFSGSEERNEVIARKSWSHLGHLFDDGPVEYNWVRYCMNSAALRFVPLADMKKEGYGIYMRFVR